MFRFIFLSTLLSSVAVTSHGSQVATQPVAGSIDTVSVSVQNALQYEGYFVVDNLAAQELEVFQEVCREVGITQYPYFVWVKPASLEKNAFSHAKYVCVQDAASGKQVGVVCLNKKSRTEFLKRRGGVAFPLYRELMYHKKGIDPAQKVSHEKQKQIDLDTFQAMRCQSCIKRALHRFWFDNWKVIFKSSDPAERLLQEKREEQILAQIPKGCVWADERFVKDYIKTNAFPGHCSYCRPSKEQKTKRSEKTKAVKHRRRVVNLEEKEKKRMQKIKSKKKKQ
ncbi:hypothetical protein EBR77_00785 [bacterium]|nr:hypothetical protein [bacterium]